MTERSELARLVEAEARLDRELAAARTAAEATRNAAHERAALAASRLELQITVERERIAAAMAAECTRREQAIEIEARATLARYAAVDGEALHALARTLARRLVAMLEEAP